MTPEQFVFWFKGYISSMPSAPTTDQWLVIKANFEGISIPIPNISDNVHPFVRYDGTADPNTTVTY